MCERDSTQLQRAYRGEYNKYLFFNGLKIFWRRSNFSLAFSSSQLHKERAFQASSPKTFKAGPLGIGPFLFVFGLALKRRAPGIRPAWLSSQ
ncbi:hypothetical protein ACFSTI_10065 [Rhizorhabdus histidinilytica]